RSHPRSRARALPPPLRRSPVAAAHRRPARSTGRRHRIQPGQAPATAWFSTRDRATRTWKLPPTRRGPNSTGRRCHLAVAAKLWRTKIGVNARTTLRRILKNSSPDWLFLGQGLQLVQKLQRLARRELVHIHRLEPHLDLRLGGDQRRRRRARCKK